MRPLSRRRQRQPSWPGPKPGMVARVAGRRGLPASSTHGPAKDRGAWPERRRRLGKPGPAGCFGECREDRPVRSRVSRPRAAAVRVRRKSAATIPRSRRRQTAPVRGVRPRGPRRPRGPDRRLPPIPARGRPRRTSVSPCRWHRNTGVCRAMRSPSSGRWHGAAAPRDRGPVAAARGRTRRRFSDPSGGFLGRWRPASSGSLRSRSIRRRRGSAPVRGAPRRGASRLLRQDMRDRRADRVVRCHRCRAAAEAPGTVRGRTRSSNLCRGEAS